MLWHWNSAWSGSSRGRHKYAVLNGWLCTLNCYNPRDRMLIPRRTRPRQGTETSGITRKTKYKNCDTFLAATVNVIAIIEIKSVPTWNYNNTRPVYRSHIRRWPYRGFHRGEWYSDIYLPIPPQQFKLVWDTAYGIYSQHHPYRSKRYNQYPYA